MHSHSFQNTPAGFRNLQYLGIAISVALRRKTLKRATRAWKPHLRLLHPGKQICPIFPINWANWRWNRFCSAPVRHCTFLHIADMAS